MLKASIKVRKGSWPGSPVRLCAVLGRFDDRKRTQLQMLANHFSTRDETAQSRKMVSVTRVYMLANPRMRASVLLKPHSRE